MSAHRLPDAGPSSKDIDSAYRRLAPRLERIVGKAVTAPHPVVEEACQVAWSQLLAANPPIRDEVVLSWLGTTAVREAWRLLRRERHHLPLGDEDQLGEVIDLPAREPGPERLAELHEQLAEIRRLPPRQQRMVWLHGAGYRYAEIAAATGDSRRTVERQLLRAKRALKDDAA
jgi:RNA polymerase sigma factor (sigma-70 family)